MVTSFRRPANGGVRFSLRPSTDIDVIAAMRPIRVRVYSLDATFGRWKRRHRRRCIAECSALFSGGGAVLFSFEGPSFLLPLAVEGQPRLIVILDAGVPLARRTLDRAAFRQWNAVVFAFRFLLVRFMFWFCFAFFFVFGPVRTVEIPTPIPRRTDRRNAPPWLGVATPRSGVTTHRRATR